MRNETHVEVREGLKWQEGAGWVGVVGRQEAGAGEEEKSTSGDSPG